MVEKNLDILFNPKASAMIGASANPRKWGFIILLNILKGDYSGKVYPVNPNEKSILGYTCYPNLASIPDPVDLAIITTPATVVPSLIDECGEKGIPFAIVITSDFSETGAEGVALEREVVARARKFGIRLVGPNSMGIFSSKTNLHAQMPLRFALADFKDEQPPNNIEGITRLSIETLSEICCEIDVGYRCIAYRAGGYRIAPATPEILTALDKYGVRFDSTFAKN